MLRILKIGFVVWMVAAYSNNGIAQVLEERKGIMTAYPAEYADWSNGLFAGNGKMGVIVFGNPLKETVIYNDRKFFMAASKERSFNQVSAMDLKLIRDFCVGGRWKEANDLANKVHGWQGGGEGDKHPGYEMLIDIPVNGSISGYVRECNFRTGEITVKWKDNRGDWERKTFVSRKDNVIVQYLTAPSKDKLNCSIHLGTDPGMHFNPGMRFTDVSDTEFLNMRVQYPAGTNNAGYEGVTKIVLSGGEKSITGGILTIKDADAVMLLTRMEKYYSDCENEWTKEILQSQLDLLSSDYTTLLEGQIETHQALFDRVKIDLGANAADRALSNETLLDKQKGTPEIVGALWERLFDSGRYLYLSSSSDVAPPDLLGLWTGDCYVGWSGFYHLDANLNLQIGGGNIGDLPEAMEGYFTLIERLSDGFKTNANKLLGCRGMLGGGNTAGLNGLISSLSYYYPYQYVTGEMGWLLYPFWEHYLVTGDKEFVRNRLYPLLKEMGYFYEDFLVNKDTNGKYIFAGSISPENQPGNEEIVYSLVNNSTFDIAGAKFCLETLIEICNWFDYEQGTGEGVERWSAILAKLPPYLINSDGALSEWSWTGLDENYGHRHSSHLITVWPLNEISKEKTPELYNAAQITLNKKDGHPYEGAGHGILHAALHAANLNNAQSVHGKLLRFVKEDFFYKSLASAHYKDFSVFCTDVCHTIPAIMMEMLVNSKNDVIELLPAIPQSMTKGSISGIKTRNQVTIEHLEWDQDVPTIFCRMKSTVDQDITLIQRRGIVSITGNVQIIPSSLGKEGSILRLKAGESVEITLKIEEAPRNLALNQPITASSVADNCPPQNAVDNDTGTRWSSAYKDQEWISVDLGSKKKMNEIRLNWEASYAESYILQVSNDAVNWLDVHTQTDGKGGIESIPLANVTGRYVRMQGVKRASVYGYSLWELEVYGTDAPSNYNLALNKAAYHSSAANYDNTAHLVTDGDLQTHKAASISCQYSDSPPEEKIEMAFDGIAETKFLTFHPACWMQYAFSENHAYAINKYTITSANDEDSRDPKNWTLQASNDGENWILLDTKSDINFSSRKQTKEFTVSNTTPYKTYRFNITANHGDERLQLSEIGLYEGDVYRIERIKLSSKWVSKTNGNQWIYIDLGTVCDIEKVKLYWDENYAQSYNIELSNDAEIWEEIYSTTSGDGNVDEMDLEDYGRYVRLNAKTGNAENYSLVEFEVYGQGGNRIIPKALPDSLPDGRQYLTGGNWKLQRAEAVSGTGTQISQAEFDDNQWIPATVPGTILTGYLNIGAIPDPNYGDYQLQISDAFFTADFWYRNSFVIPKTYEGKKVFLNFDGINWKADIYVNGYSCGRIEGAFIRGKFDITDFVTPGKTAYLAVYIHKNDTPGTVTLQSLEDAGFNGGALGADNPTIHASVGWDWLPTIRGRNIGIQDNVFLSASQGVSIQDPFVITKEINGTPNDASGYNARLEIKIDVKNDLPATVSGILKGVINPGNITFNQNVTLNASERTTITTEVLLPDNPPLWWPNGYGDPFLHQLDLTFETGNGRMDTKQIEFGVRKITTTTTGNMLTVYVNGKRIYLRGGNWGLSEAQLRLDKEGYDLRVRLHKEENFTMIRNWVGQTGSDYFYQACDKYGLLVWDDFWLANPGDGPNPNDEAMFMTNAIDKIKRVRNHPSVALYCGRNEGNPPETLNTALRNAVETFDGTRFYIPYSAGDLVGGFGPYSVKDPKSYFTRSSPKIHSEIGMPNVPSLESMQAMLPEDKQWPVNEMWGIHDYCNSAQKADDYTLAVNKYGTPNSLADFCLKAQMVNMENHKAMFESFVNSKADGALMWMSQSAWPSTVWQTYDYYLEQTAGYYGCKKASEPLHIFWDHSSKVKVANNTGKSYSELLAEAKIYNMDGTVKYTKSLPIALLNEDEVKYGFTITYPDGLSDVHFLKLTLKQGDKVLSDNFYWRGKIYQTYNSLEQMNQITLEGALKKSVQDSTQNIQVRISNPTDDIALMIRIKVLKNVSDERVLPVFYSDNYFSLLPHESKIVTLEFDSKQVGDEQAKVMVEGWNINAMEITDELTGIENIQPNDISSVVGIYPNPTNKLLYVKGMSEFDVDIFDLTGIKVLHCDRQNDSIDISSLPSGTYLVKLSNGKQQACKTIIKKSG
ncbi:MAG: discoidin domain-containing protein [Candidatus Symbiothrix sp.]|nr:discoidin domain-containing protein [Candidatus Symbiothrix sp.]